MNHSDEQRIAELAMKSVARQITPTEQAELNALVAREPAARGDFEQRLAEAQALAGAASLLNATESRSGELPGYARERLRAKVRDTFGVPGANPKATDPGPWWKWQVVWRWALGCAVIVAVIISLVPRPQETVLHLALLDPAGDGRGSETSDVAALQSGWPDAEVSTFKTTDEVAAWRNGLASAGEKDTVFVIYDRSVGELQVSGTKRGRIFEKRFEVEQNLASVLEQARQFIREQGRPN